MLRILSSCTATVRKSLQGLDYFAAEEAKAFDDLTALGKKLGDRHWVLKFQQLLKEGKQYLKTDYKVSNTKFEFVVRYTNITQQDQAVDHVVCFTRIQKSPGVQTSRVICTFSMSHYLISTE